MGLVDLKSNLAELRSIQQGSKLEDSVDPDPIITNSLRSTIHRPYVNTIIDSEKTPSPIEILHNDTATISSPSKDGLTSRIVSGYPLGEYYSQLNTDNRLGIRKNSKFGPEQPFVVREIGDNWDNPSSNDLYDNVGTKLSDNDNLLLPKSNES